MCGIAGLIAAGRTANAAAVDAMCGLMRHRGPDGGGLWQADDGRAVLGHRRLAIIDPGPASAQPMVRGPLALTYNGEIYNYLELRHELEGLGARFSTAGDGEVLLRAWEIWGPECVRRFNGMFAFALHDQTRRVLFCARDRFGEKPFLYAPGDGWLAFASEYKALLALDGISSAFDRQRLSRFLLTPGDGLDRGSDTVFPAIRQLPPAHWMSVSLDDLSVRQECYWTGAPDPEAASLDVPQAAERFRALLDDSVRLRLRSDVPVGSCLSGGLDSGAIGCLVRRQLGPHAAYHTFSGRFPGETVDEGPYMDALAATIAPVRHEVSPQPAHLLDELADFAWANELPMDSASQYAQYCVFRLAREQGVLVLLDGQGADEILGGYEQYFAAYLAGTGGTDEAAIRARYPGALDQLTPWHAHLPAGLRRRLARWTGKGSDFAFGLTADATPVRRPPCRTLHAALRRDATDGFLGTLLRYGDRNSMAHSVEVRLPFTDHRLFELAQGLAAPVLMGDAQTKRLLREAMRAILPEMVRTRWRKQGFLPPHAVWLQGPLLAAATAVITDPALGESGLWDVSWWRQALARFTAGDTALAGGLWKVLATETWRRDFVARTQRQPKLPPLL